MLSWRGAGVGSNGVGRDDIMLLLDDDRIVRGASSGTALDQQAMQIDQRRQRRARRANGHAGAGDRIQHPGRHHNDNAGLRLDVDELAAGAPFAVVPPNPAPMERMPAVVDLDLRLDMGRMTQRLPSAAGTGPSPAPTPAVTAPRRCTRSSAPPSSTASTRKPGCATSLPASPMATRSAASKTCFPGIGRLSGRPQNPQARTPPDTENRTRSLQTVARLPSPRPRPDAYGCTPM